MTVAFTAQEYQPDGTIRPADYAFAGTTTDGWELRRDGRPHLRLGPGYRLLEVSHCGICSTDLARRHLPFPLPQITGHEVVARDDAGRPVVVEINASHAARGLDHAAWCAHCRAGMPTHCPERLVVGIHDLPGGFSPWMLAPVDAVAPVPAALSPATATLVEPFAAALAAVRALQLADGERVLVLGPGRLGSLVVAALAAWRRRTNGRFGILVAGRRPSALARAKTLGADEIVPVTTLADVVVETTGSPDGLALALGLATREVHVKSTTGQSTMGLRHLTELVVDEVSLQPWAPGGTLPVGASTVVVPAHAPETLRRALSAAGLQAVTPDEARGLPLGGADVGVAFTTAEVDALLRPVSGVERGLVRARSTILLVDGGGADAGDLVSSLRRRGLRLGSSRCGDFGAALDLLVDPTLAHRLGERMVTDVVQAARLDEGFARAAAGGKVIVAHPGALV